MKATFKNFILTCMYGILPLTVAYLRGLCVKMTCGNVAYSAQYFGVRFRNVCPVKANDKKMEKRNHETGTYKNEETLL